MLADIDRMLINIRPMLINIDPMLTDIHRMLISFRPMLISICPMLINICPMLTDIPSVLISIPGFLSIFRYITISQIGITKITGVTGTSIINAYKMHVRFYKYRLFITHIDLTGVWLSK